MWGLRQLSEQMASLSLGRLQWIAIVTPGLLIIAWELLSLLFIHRVLVSDVYLFVLTAVALALGAIVFTMALFAIIERMQHDLVARNRQLAVLEERDRIAMETHDGFAQMLGGLVARLKAIDELARLGRIKELEEHTRQAEQVVQGAYADVREYILGLKTPVARGREFMDAVGEFLRSFSQHHRLPVEWYLVKSKRTYKSNCAACHDLPTVQRIQAFPSGEAMVEFVIGLTEGAHASEENTTHIVRYFLALRHDTAS